MPSITAKLVLISPYGEKRESREWFVSANDDGSIILSFKDLADALEVIRGSYIHRLELQTVDGKPLRTLEHLSQAIGGPILAEEPTPEQEPRKRPEPVRTEIVNLSGGS